MTKSATVIVAVAALAPRWPLYRHDPAWWGRHDRRLSDDGARPYARADGQSRGRRRDGTAGELGPGARVRAACPSRWIRPAGGTSWPRRRRAVDLHRAARAAWSQARVRTRTR